MALSHRRVPYPAAMRRELLAGVLGLGLAALWWGAAAAQTWVSQAGPQVEVRSVTDDGGGRIRISWSLEAAAPDVRFRNSHPQKVCVWWGAVENGTPGPVSETCFTGEASSQADLLIDTGIGGDGPTAVYAAFTVPYYNNIPMRPYGDGAWRTVTLNG